VRISFNFLTYHMLRKYVYVPLSIVLYISLIWKMSINKIEN